MGFSFSPRTVSTGNQKALKNKQLHTSVGWATIIDRSSNATHNAPEITGKKKPLGILPERLHRSAEWFNF
jgi:hypothetical protein